MGFVDKNATLQTKQKGCITWLPKIAGRSPKFLGKRSRRRESEQAATNRGLLQSSPRGDVVEVTGFEPTTSWSRTMRATKLRYTSARKIIAHSQFLFNCFSINIIAENYKTSLITYIILRKKL